MTTLVAWILVIRAKLFAALVLPALPMDPSSGPIIDYHSDKVSPRLKAINDGVLSNALYVSRAIFIIMGIAGFVRLGFGARRGSVGMIIAGVIGTVFAFFPNDFWQVIIGFVRDITGI